MRQRNLERVGHKPRCRPQHHLAPSARGELDQVAHQAFELRHAAPITWTACRWSSVSAPGPRRQQRVEALDLGERRPQLVRHVRDEVALQLVELRSFR